MSFTRCLSLAIAAAALAAPAQALYKVVGPDGKVTYTDRAPGPADGRAAPVGGRSAPAETSVPLPLELRQAATRFPVTLYTLLGVCEPCDTARQLLKQRGVPYSERQVVTAADSEALQRLTGGREAPAVTIGGQLLRGLSSDVWNSYLDTAGYPRQSILPAGYQYPAPTPLTEQRAPAPAAEEAPRAPARTEPAAEPASPGAPQIRF